MFRLTATPRIGYGHFQPRIKTPQDPLTRKFCEINNGNSKQSTVTIQWKTLTIKPKEVSKIHDSESIKNLFNSSKHGNPQAQYDLAVLLEKGEVLDRDVRQSADLCYRAAMQGHPKAQLLLAKFISCYDQNEEGAFYWFLKAAEKGNLEAQLAVASYYSAVKKDYRQAFYWAMKAANKEVPEAQMIVCALYSEGKGVEQNLYKAAYWAEQAAKSGLPAAEHFIGLCYAYGRGIKFDRDQAIFWLECAIGNGEFEAYIPLGDLYLREFEWRAFCYYLLAAKKEIPLGRLVCGICVELGIGHAIDYKKAIEHYKEAAKLGEKEAAYRICALHKEGRVDINDNEAMLWVNENVQLKSDRIMFSFYKNRLERVRKRKDLNNLFLIEKE